MKDYLTELLSPIGNPQWDVAPRNTKSFNYWQPDLCCILTIKRSKYTLLFELKYSGEPKVIEWLIGKLGPLREKDGYPVLVAPYVGERGRALCMNNNLGFVDLSGNAYLRFNGILLDRWGKDNKWKDRRLLRSLFTTASTYIIRSMFASPDKAWTMKELADSAQISIGGVSKIINRLHDEGLVSKEWGSIRLEKPGDLLDLWREDYDFGDNEITGYFCSLKDREKIFGRLRKEKKPGYFLTLGAAASIVAPAVRSTDVHMYVPGPKEPIIEVLDLKPVEFGGNVYLIRPQDDGIWRDPQEWEGLHLVSNLQLYLDLYKYPMRGREQAEAVREQRLGV